MTRPALRPRIQRLPRIRHVVLAVSCILPPASLARAQAPRNLLSGHVTEAQIAAVLVPADRWHPYPTIDDRAAWDSVPDSIRVAYIRAAEREVGRPWGFIPATLILDFARNGSRAAYDSMNEERRRRLATLVMAELFENRGRFLDEIANGIWALCEQSFWGSTAHLGMQRAGNGLPDVQEPVVELFSGEAAALLAWTDYLLGARLDRVSPLLRRRIRYEVDRRVLTPALERDDFWWMGFGARQEVNNWNPWINSNWLASVLILERDPARRARAVYKIMRSLDVFLNGYPDDGGCDEGPSYWDRAAASLFDNLELLRTATGGRVDIFDTPLVGNMGRYIYRVYIGGDWFVNMGDASARLRPDAELIYRYGTRIHDPVMQGFGAFVARRRGGYRPGGSSLGRIVPAVLSTRAVAEAAPEEPLLGDVWLPGLQLMAARAVPGSDRGFYLAAWGGDNGQSHNHNDVGNFIAYADGQPVLIDVGVGTYTAKTFSAHRYDIWTMQSAFHNLPTINGVMQKDGTRYRAQDVRFDASKDAVRFSLDIARAYPDSAGVRSWRRTLTLDRRADDVQIEDAYVLERVAAPLTLNFMTPLRVDVSTPGLVRLRDAATKRDYTLRYDPAQFGATAEEIAIDDARLRPVWGERIARVVLTSRGTGSRGSYRLGLREER